MRVNEMRRAQEQIRDASERDAKSARADTSKRRDKSRFKSRLFDTALSLLFVYRYSLPKSIFSRSSYPAYSLPASIFFCSSHPVYSLPASIFFRSSIPVYSHLDTAFSLLFDTRLLVTRICFSFYLTLLGLWNQGERASV